MAERSEEEKARRKEAHRVSMVASGGVFVFMALAGFYILVSKSGMPAWLMGKSRPAGLPRVEIPEKFQSRVIWEDWGPEVVARAKRENKLILLKVCAQWSYACRLMEYRAYSNRNVDELVTSRFIPARADSDDRPDAALRYMAHGWPTTAVLLPNGQILDSATYMEPDVLERWLQALQAGWEKGRARAEAAAAKALEERANAEPLGLPKAEAVARRARAELELEGEPPLYPRWKRWRLLKSLLPELAAARLNAALALEDPGGGFFRYAHGAGYSEPEREKSFDDQAQAALALRGLDESAAARAASALDRFSPARPGHEALAAAARWLVRKDAKAKSALLSLAKRKPSPLLQDALELTEALLLAGEPALAAEAALAGERLFMDEKTGALFDRVAPGELPEPLDRLLDPGLNFEAWRLYGELARALPPGDPRRQRFLARAQALRPWTLARAAWLDAGARLLLATPAP